MRAVAIGLSLLYAAGVAAGQLTSDITVRVLDPAGVPIVGVVIIAKADGSASGMLTDGPGQATASVELLGADGAWCGVIIPESCELLPPGIIPGVAEEDQQQVCDDSLQRVLQAGSTRSGSQYVWLVPGSQRNIDIQLLPVVEATVALTNGYGVSVRTKMLVETLGEAIPAILEAAETSVQQLVRVPLGNPTMVILRQVNQHDPTRIIRSYTPPDAANSVLMPATTIERVAMSPLPRIETVGRLDASLEELWVSPTATLVREDGVYVREGVYHKGAVIDLYGMPDEPFMVPPGRYYVVPGLFGFDDTPWLLLDRINANDPMLGQPPFITIGTDDPLDVPVQVNLTAIAETLRGEGPDNAAAGQ